MTQVVGVAHRIAENEVIAEDVEGFSALRDPERRRYYPDEETAPLSEAVLEAVEAHESDELSVDDFDLDESVNPRAIDMLFHDPSDIEVSVTIALPDVIVSIWSDGGIDIRVTERDEQWPQWTAPSRQPESRSRLTLLTRSLFRRQYARSN